MSRNFIKTIGKTTRRSAKLVGRFVKEKPMQSTIIAASAGAVIGAAAALGTGAILRRR